MQRILHGNLLPLSLRRHGIPHGASPATSKATTSLFGSWRGVPSLHSIYRRRRCVWTSIQIHSSWYNNFTSAIFHTCRPRIQYTRIQGHLNFLKQTWTDNPVENAPAMTTRSNFVLLMKKTDNIHSHGGMERSKTQIRYVYSALGLIS